MPLNKRLRQRKTPLLLALCCLLSSCSSDEKKGTTQDKGLVVEYIFRQGSSEMSLAPPRPAPPLSYPWSPQEGVTLPPISKEYFRCKGNSGNPPRILKNGAKECERIYDCGGVEKHSLPVRNNNEFVYPILVELLNWIQAKTQKQVIITSAHRCPSHHAWVDPSQRDSPSKHLIGAEVDFYVQGMESQPDAVIAAILDFYTSHPRYAEKKEYSNFKRSDKPTNTSTKPFYNKEIFIKKFLVTEGRNGDSSHRYPYLSIQVRYDRDNNQPVAYTWADSQKYLRK